MKAWKRILTVLLVTAVILTAIFLAGRYGWKLGGFRACQGAGITSVKVSEKAVHITGFYPGSFSKGFCGYYAKEQDGKLYVGFRFSAVFGFFETGVFDITIPVKGEISEVILKTSMNETSVWNAQTGFLTQSEPVGLLRRSAHFGTARGVRMGYEANCRRCYMLTGSRSSSNRLHNNRDLKYIVDEEKDTESIRHCFK